MTERFPLEETPAAKAPESRGLYLYGVQRARSWRGRRVSETAEGLLRVRYRELEAIVRATPFEMPPLDAGAVAEHQRVVEGEMRRGTILPAPYGIIFHGRRPLLRMLQDQYLMLDEALGFIDDQCEVRLHVSSVEAHDQQNATDVALQIYSELRRHARAAVPFPREDGNVLSAAFLVDKGAWVDFIQRAEDLGSHHIEISIDITGPWPPYDFVRFVA